MTAEGAARDSDLLRYLARERFSPGERLPAIHVLAEELGLSTGKLREQLEVARQLGLVDVRPKTGIRATGYSFLPGVWVSLRHALSLDPVNFYQFEALRNHVEEAFFDEAVRALAPEDLRRLKALVDRAWERLRGDPIQIPHGEHRELHLTIYSRLDNPFVRGLLEAYWEAYESVGLSVYADYGFLHDVWTYHEKMVDNILAGEFEEAHRTLVEHTGLVQYRPRLARPAGNAAGGAAASGLRPRRGVRR